MHLVVAAEEESLRSAAEQLRVKIDLFDLVAENSSSSFYLNHDAPGRAVQIACALTYLECSGIIYFPITKC
jgi:hypothetical protein